MWCTEAKDEIPAGLHWGPEGNAANLYHKHPIVKMLFKSQLPHLHLVSFWCICEISTWCWAPETYSGDPRWSSGLLPLAYPLPCHCSREAEQQIENLTVYMSLLFHGHSFKQTKKIFLKVKCLQHSLFSTKTSTKYTSGITHGISIKNEKIQIQ